MPCSDVQKSYEMPDEPGFPPKWAFPDLTDEEYEELKANYGKEDELQTKQEG